MKDNWETLAPGIFRRVIGNPMGETPLSVLKRLPLRDALERKGKTDLPPAASEMEEERRHSAIIIRVPLLEDERLYGLGLQFFRMNHRGRTRYMRVNSDPGQDTGETHAPVPLLVADRGCGILVNTSRAITIHCGSTKRLKDTRPEEVRDRNRDSSWRATPVSDFLEIVLPAEGAELILIGGPAMLDVVERYNLLCGGGTLPPRWGLGFWHRMPSLYGEQEVREEARQFRDRGIPCDVIGLEPGWHSASYPATYDWSLERYPNPALLTEQLGEQGFRVNLWEHPYVSPQSSLYDKLSPLSGNYSVWGGAAPDYTMEEARQAYKDHHDANHLAIGVSGYKHDECDGSELTNASWMFPAHASFPSGHDGEQMRQLYGLLLQHTADEMFRKINRRTFGLVRASNAGASSLPYVLYSDKYDHRQYIRALCNCSFSGLLWTPEVRRAEDAEDWVRRMQTVCFSPLAMLNAWGDGTKPWSYPEVEPIIRHYIRLRMRLMPYLYTAFARYRFYGTPPFRAMPLVMLGSEGDAVMETGEAVDTMESLDTVKAAYGASNERVWDDQYMVGEDLLVAPLFAGETSREVLLPPGIWYELETGERHDGGVIIRADAGLERIPVYVRGGAILPLAEAVDHVPNRGSRLPVQLVHFGDSPGECLLYDDDGETFDYERGHYKWVTFQAKRDDRGKLVGTSADEADRLMSYEIIGWEFGASRLPEDH
ncbi:TIM-barrel domain-containing protein [Paenibacillus sp. GCM10023252]|uniref:glycoside hydrolase family 31 protein n=1 Tax=Paenibacillus sp. GCM10023252 TaxID=3252649 RepID=UPI0036211516